MRGCRKSVVFLKNTGSEIFEEAYFVLRSDAERSRSEKDIIREANRIIDENSTTKRRIRIKKAIPYLLAFFSGGIMATVITVFLSNAIK